MERETAPISRASTVAFACRVAVVVALAAMAACSDDQAEPGTATADTGAASLPVLDGEEQEALQDASTAFSADLADVQRLGSSALAPGGDVAGFYRSFATTTRDAVARYEALQLPPEVAGVRSRLLTLLDEQATVLDNIASGAANGEDSSLTPQLERLTELLGDVSTTNAELLRSMEVDAPGLGT